MTQPTRLLRPWDFPSKNTGMGCCFLLQGLFPTQGSNPGLPHCRQTLYCLSHQGSPNIAIDQRKLFFWWNVSWNASLESNLAILLGIFFPVVTYRYESWATKKAECQRIDAFELWYWRRLLRVPWIARRSNQSFIKEINPE